ncbi:MAG: accessory factor UbiK family protein [Candidatus Liberibacter ctenarytainae]|uniref:Accessory factor UbiK family protein n=1 Tax=Candidatus Liberibacter ctenarytainae TaxID=2020335 RepID=A0A937AIU1_9HYPH|nr:accessory factor UbiK family protein [Candidatus Liberibacter ctenarytainae]
MSFKSDHIFKRASDFAHCASEAFRGISKEAESAAHIKLQKTMNSMGVVRREELEAMRYMTSKIHDELSSLSERLDKLEKKVSKL